MTRMSKSGYVRVMNTSGYVRVLVDARSVVVASDVAANMFWLLGMWLQIMTIETNHDNRNAGGYYTDAERHVLLRLRMKRLRTMTRIEKVMIKMFLHGC